MKERAKEDLAPLTGAARAFIEPLYKDKILSSGHEPGWSHGSASCMS